jgi:Phosphotransferase enzyme family
VVSTNSSPVKLEAPAPPRKFKVPAQPSEKPYHLPEPDGDLRIIRPLAPEVQEVLRLSNRGLQTLQSGSTEKRSSRSCPAQLLLGAIKQGKVIWHLGVFVVQLSPRIVVKFGSGMPIDEAVTMTHILTHAPNLAMPASLGVASISIYNYHFMTFIPGVSLDKVWPTLTVSQKKSIQVQLAAILKCLRQIPLPQDPAIGSGDPPRCRDFRRNVRICPKKIYTEKEFNAFLLSNPFKNHQDWGISPFYLHMLRSRLRTDHGLSMTHGDVRPANIIVERTSNNTDVRINGLIDWGDGGVYPEYWEYVRSLYLFNVMTNNDWYEYLPTEEGMGCYVDEYLLDDHIDRIVGGR